MLRNVLTQHIREFLQVTPGPFPDFWVGPGDEAMWMGAEHVGFEWYVVANVDDVHCSLYLLQCYVENFEEHGYINKHFISSMKPKVQSMADFL